MPKTHKYHSGQFCSSVQKRWLYWTMVLQQMKTATFKILNPTSYYGFCGNAIATGGTSTDDAPNSGADFSFEAAKDTREIAGTIEANRIWAPIYCKDYGAWCQVEITLQKNGVVIGGPTLITLPLDTNGDKLADSWQDAQNLKWNAQFNPASMGSVLAWSHYS